VIEIDAATSSLTTNTATLQTRETWRVSDASGRVVYREDNAHHTVSLIRVQSYVLHEWDVSAIQ
jgi:hypothetical protein